MDNVSEVRQGVSAEPSAIVGQQAVARGRSGVWARFRKHRAATVGLVVLGLLVVASVFAPLIARQDPYTTNIRSYRQAPSAEHVLGNDASGRDVFSRLLHAGRVSLAVGLVAVGIYALIGLVLGGLAGYHGGWIDSVIMRAADIVLSFPLLIIIITLVSILGPSIFNVMLVIGLLG